MTTSFSELKRASSSNFDKLNQELSKLNTAATYAKDERLWSPTTDKAGNGYAVIRFLPAPQGEDVPFVRIWSHGFKGPGGWYIENSLSTIGKEDPVAEWNRQLWNSGRDSDKTIVSGSGKDNPGTKRQLNYYSNIYVVRDPEHPENEGKVFLYRYGKKIFDKLNDLMNPQFEGEEPVNPFDLWSGANFKLKIRRVEGYPNYDKSEFDSPGPLLDDDAKLEAVWKAEYSLQEFLAPKNFKSYDELKTRLDRVRGLSSAPAVRQEVENETPAPQARSKPAPRQNTVDDDDDDEEFALFKRMAEEDEAPF